MNLKLISRLTSISRLGFSPRMYRDVFILISLFFLFPINPAWSQNHVLSPNFLNVSHETYGNTHTCSSIVTDACKPLLNTFHHVPSISLTDRNQRSVGNTAALSVKLYSYNLIDSKLHAFISNNYALLTHYVRQTNTRYQHSAQITFACYDCLNSSLMK